MRFVPQRVVYGSLEAAAPVRAQPCVTPRKRPQGRVAWGMDPPLELSARKGATKKRCRYLPSWGA